jgi:Xaa-Pro aminopeptidase
MDVHDVGDYRVDGEWRLLEPGMVLTIEPGLYIPRDCEKVDKQWRGIGIRIEDDVLVTQSGHEVLTRSVPKTVAEIEQLMQGESGIK